MDFTPGSGTLATACLMMGVPYHGVASSAAHMGWLQNVLDRRALQVLTDKSWALYTPPLATLVQEHFGDVLAELAHMDAAEDTAPEGEEPAAA